MRASATMASMVGRQATTSDQSGAAAPEDQRAAGASQVPPGSKVPASKSQPCSWEMPVHTADACQPVRWWSVTCFC